METIVKEETKQKTVLSGITPSSTSGLHLGNYFGAVKPHVDLQDEAKCFYFVANLHALNTVHEGPQVSTNTENVFIEYLAFGIDPEKTNFYIESDVQAIPYLQTILNNLVSVAEIKRMHAFKDKLQDGAEADQINMGLFSYAILMAADILIMRPDVIPVGEDQSQHVELARTIAKRFNKRYGRILHIPKLQVKKEAARVRGIDGVRKMSKSLGNDLSVFANEETIRKQIFSITTDPSRIHPTDPGDPDKNIAFEYLDLLDFGTDKVEAMREKYRTGNIKDVEIKQDLYDRFLEYFTDSRKKKQALLNDRDYVADVRREGAKKANNIADETMIEVRKLVGLV